MRVTASVPEDRGGKRELSHSPDRRLFFCPHETPLRSHPTKVRVSLCSSLRHASVCGRAQAPPEATNEKVLPVINEIGLVYSLRIPAIVHSCSFD